MSTLRVNTIELGHASDTTLTRVSAGIAAIDGEYIYSAGGVDVLVTDGGTGRSTGTTAYSLIATGVTPTSAQQTLANGATTEILVGGGASALPVWTTATGTGAPVRSTSPTLVTPVLGTATATSINKVTITQPVTGSTLTVANGKTLTASNTLTFTGTDGSSVAFGAGGTVLYSSDIGSTVQAYDLELAAIASVSSAANKIPYFTGSGTAALADFGPAVRTFLTNSSSSNLASIITDETGSGSLVFATSPTLVTPVLGTATATSINKVTITQPVTGSTLTVANGKTLTASNTLTFTGTDGSSVAFGTGGTVLYSSDIGSTVQAFDTELAAFAFITSSADKIPYFTGHGTAALADFGPAVRTFLTTSNSANLAALVTDETGTGSLVFGTSPAITTSITTPSSTFALVNTTATTVNFAGSATTINIGAGTGTTTINNNLSVPGNITNNNNILANAFITSANLTTSDTTKQIVVSLASGTYRTIKALIQVTSGSSYQSCELMLLHNGTTVQITEYANLYTSSVLASFDADISAGNIRLFTTPVNAVTVYKVLIQSINL